MPIFEHRCSECGAATEVLERAGNHGQRRCSQCGGRRLEKLFSTFASVGGASASARGECAAPRRGGFK